MSRNRALVIGVSQYSAPEWNLPAVAADVREIASLLGSEHGSFDSGKVHVVTDTEVTKSTVLEEVERVFAEAASDDTVFLYLAGHGTSDSSEDSFYFIPYDADPNRIFDTAVPLVELRELFDSCKSQRAFMWLDFCHSGGIIDRSAVNEVEDAHSIERALNVIHGQGKLIYAACTPDQKAYENSVIGHGLFTKALLDGLKGAAEVDGEVTANSLFDYIDRTIGSNRQRPMQFGRMTGRVVLMHFDGPPTKHVAMRRSRTSDLSSSGSWLLLGSQFFESTSVTDNSDGTITVELASTDANQDACIRGLRPDEYGRGEAVPFAYRNIGHSAHVIDVQGVSSGDTQTWTVTLKPEDVSNLYGMMEMSYAAGKKKYSPDDFARMRAGRLLMNDPPAQYGDRNRAGFDQVEDSMMESFIRGTSGAIPVEDCVIQAAYRQFGDTPEFRLFARLMAVYFIRCAGIAEEILELSIGPVVEDCVAVRFKGRRPRVYSNVDPVQIEVEGKCPLSE